MQDRPFKHFRMYGTSREQLKPYRQSGETIKYLGWHENGFANLRNPNPWKSMVEVWGIENKHEIYQFPEVRQTAGCV